MLRFIWALPYTLAGILPAVFMMFLGARAAVRGGVLEVWGGHPERWFENKRKRPFISTITLGQIILSVSARELERLRSHERVHVRQYRCWGPFFGPLYLASTLIQLFRGKHPYFDNAFEKEAFKEGPV